MPEFALRHVKYEKIVNLVYILVLMEKVTRI